MYLLQLSFNWTFLGWNAPFYCIFMWTREKHAGWSFGLIVFFFSQMRKFLGNFIWVLGSCGWWSQERKRNVPKSERRKVSNYGNYSWLSDRVIFHRIQIKIFPFFKFLVSPMTWRACYWYRDRIATNMEAWRGNLRA